MSDKPVPMLTCRFCATDLKPGAVYCTECKQFQSRTQALLGKVTVPIFLSLVTAAFGGYAFLKRNVILPRAEMSATALSCDADQVTVGVSNTGTRPAIFTVGHARLTVGRSQTRLLLSDALPIVIAPSESKVLKLAYHSTGELREPAPMARREEKCAYDIRLDVRDFGNVDRSPNSFKCECL